MWCWPQLLLFFGCIAWFDCWVIGLLAWLTLWAHIPPGSCLWCRRWAYKSCPLCRPPPPRTWSGGRKTSSASLLPHLPLIIQVFPTVSFVPDAHLKLGSGLSCPPRHQGRYSMAALYSSRASLRFWFLNKLLFVSQVVIVSLISLKKDRNVKWILVKSMVYRKYWKLIRLNKLLNESCLKITQRGYPDVKFHVPPFHRVFYQ